MKQNPCPVVGEITKPTSIGLDELDGAIESFSACIADSVLAEVEQTGLMTSQHLGHFFDGLQAASQGVGGPGIEEPLGSPFVVVAPELGEVLLDGPRSTGLEIELVQGPKGDRLSAAAIRIPLQPRPLAASQRRRARFGQTAVFLFAHRVHRLTEVFGDVKLVVHDVGLRHARLGRTHKGRPHIHGHRADRSPLARRERFQQCFSRFKLSLRNQIKHPRTVNVGQDGRIAVALLGTLLIDAQIGNLFLGAAQHAALHRADHDVVDRAPGQSREVTYALRSRTGLEQLDDEAGHQGGDPAIALSPGDDQFFDRAVAVLELGNARFDDGLKLAGVQMLPLTFRPAVDVGSSGGVRWIGPHLTSFEDHLNHYALLSQRQVN